MMTTVDTRVRKRHVNLSTQQRRLRHLESVSACNIECNVDVTNEKEIAIFFTLHSDSESPAFYTSERTHDIVNPVWRNFDPLQLPERVNMSAPSAVVKIWIWNDDTPIQIIEWHVFFSGLQYLGQQVLRNDKKFKHNTLIFGMLQGYYTAPSSIQQSVTLAENSSFDATIQVEPAFVRTAYVVSTLQRIHTIQRAIKQTQSSILKVRGRIHEHLQCAQRNEEKRTRREELRMKVNLLIGELKAQKSRLKADEEHLVKLKENNLSKDAEVNVNSRELRTSRFSFQETRKNFIETRENLLKTSAQLALRRKQLISELSYIYPILEVPGRGFTICGVNLPNSEDFVGQDETKLAVSLGYVSHLVTMVSQFLDVPLRYPVKHFGSRSKIIDHVMDKIPDKEREFPLYSKGKDKIQFNYGVYLLNKNVAQLRYYCGFTTQDLRATLPNLQTLLDLHVGKLENQSSGSQSLSDRSMLSNSSSKLNMAPIVSGGGIGVMSRNVRLGSESSSTTATTGSVQRYRNTGTPCSLPSSELMNDCSELDAMALAMIQGCVGGNGNSTVSTPKHGAMMIHSGNDVIVQNSAKCCSLDKGLDELETCVDPSKYSNQCGGGRRNAPRGGVDAAVSHGGSEPNLLKHLVVGVNIDIGEGYREDCRRLFFNPPPMEMWATGSSHANSEDDLLGHDVSGRRLVVSGEEGALAPDSSSSFSNDASFGDGGNGKSPFSINGPATVVSSSSSSSSPPLDKCKTLGTLSFQAGTTKPTSSSRLDSSREIEV